MGINIRELVRSVLSDKVRKETFWSLIAKAIFVISGLFILVFVPNKAGIETYGAFSLILSYIAVTGVFFGTSIHVAVKKEISEDKFGKKSRSIFYESIKLKLIHSIIGSLIFLIILSFVDINVLKENFWCFLLLMLSMNLWGSVVTYFEAAHRLFYNVILYSIEYFVQISMVLYFYFTNALTLESLLISFITGYFLSFICGMAILSGKLGKLSLKNATKLNFMLDKKILKRTFFIAFTGVSFVILTKIDAIMISFLLTMEDVGFYNIAADITKHATIASVPFILGVAPMFVKKNIKGIFRSTMKKLLLINLLIFLFFIAFSGIIIKLLYGSSFSQVAVLTRILGLYPMMAVGQSFMQEILILKDRTKEIFIIGLCAAAISIALNYTFITLFGIIGAAISTVASYFGWMLASYLFVKKNYLKT